MGILNVESADEKLAVGLNKYKIQLSMLLGFKWRNFNSLPLERDRV